MLIHIKCLKFCHRFFLGICFNLMLVLLLSHCAPMPIWPSPISAHKSSIPALWIKTDVYAVQNSQPLIVSSPGRIFLLGSNSKFSESNVIAFDSQTGNLLWQSNDTNGQSIISLQSKVVVGGIGEVFALDISNGNTLWSTSLPLSRSVTNMYNLKNLIYVDTVSSRYFVLDENSGEILQTVEYDASNLPYWRNIPNGAYWQSPVFYNNYVYGRTGLRIGRAFAIDVDNTSELWSTSDNVISNIWVTSSYAYVVTQDGKLLKINLKTGQQKVIVEFDLTPFKLTNQATGGFEYSYYIVVDPGDEKLVYVLLGDSAQLFAFQLP